MSYQSDERDNRLLFFYHLRDDGEEKLNRFAALRIESRLCIIEVQERDSEVIQRTRFQLIAT